MSAWRFPESRPQPLRAAVRIPDLPRLLTLASLTPTKDQLTLVRALAQLADLGLDSGPGRLRSG